LNHRSARRFFSRAAALAAALLLAACATQPLVIDDPDWQRHEASVATLNDWQLAGRLVVRQDGQSDTANISWLQQDEAFDLRLFGSLGFGAVRVIGAANSVTVEKAGEAPVTFPSLGAVTREYFGYEFPAADLLYWVRGLPAPRPGSSTLDDNRMLATLRQSDASGQEWSLTLDRYMEVDGAPGLYLPGRILAQREGLELRFLVSSWAVSQEIAPDKDSQEAVPQE
jgi:outer membrane lipoprotein LolB